MLKVLVIKPDKTYIIEELAEPIYKAIGQEVDGYFEIVRPRRQLYSGMCFCVNEEGLFYKLPLNCVGTMLYGGGSPIVGTIVITKEVMGPEGADFVSLSDAEIERVLLYLLAGGDTATTIGGGLAQP